MFSNMTMTDTHNAARENCLRLLPGGALQLRQKVTRPTIGIHDRHRPIKVQVRGDFHPCRSSEAVLDCCGVKTLLFGGYPTGNVGGGLL